tara:strand:+ start:366 stop:1136 length:771 start_codon:yes stop_codon:yes gene_type:complete
MNVLKQLDWTSTPKNGRGKAPKVIVKAKKLDGSQLKQTVNGYMALARGTTSAKQFYNKLYKTTPGPRYVFPYFGDNFRQFTNDFADTLTNVTDRGQATAGASALEAGKDIIDNALGLVDTVRQLQGTVNQSENPGSYIETPKFYQFANTDAALQVQFPLLNTVSEGAAEKNLKFIKDFIKINRPHRENAIAMSFPHVYQVKVPGLRFIKWAYLSDLSFGLLGTRRMIGGNIVPEGYTCSMTFNSLTVEVANFLDDI